MLALEFTQQIYGFVIAVLNIVPQHYSYLFNKADGVKSFRQKPDHHKDNRALAHTTLDETNVYQTGTTLDDLAILLGNWGARNGLCGGTEPFIPLG
jgi:hypothetical protein